jgi:hypothetical protein
MPIATSDYICSVSGEGMGAAVQQEGSFVFNSMVALVSLAYPGLCFALYCIYFVFQVIQIQVITIRYRTCQ